jgi:asparaginyl-tRNA synthetase
MADLAGMDLSELKAQLETVRLAVEAKEAGTDAAVLAKGIVNPYSKLYNRVSISAIHACPGAGASLIGSTVVGLDTTLHVILRL